MNPIIMFISLLGCIIVGDLATGFIMTLLFTPNPMEQTAMLDQTYLFYVVTALLATILFSIILKHKKRIAPNNHL